MEHTFYPGDKLLLKMQVKDWYPDVLQATGDLDSWSHARAEVRRVDDAGRPTGRMLHATPGAKIEGNGQELEFFITIGRNWNGHHCLQLQYGDKSFNASHTIAAGDTAFDVLPLAVPEQVGEAEIRLVDLYRSQGMGRIMINGEYLVNIRDKTPFGDRDYASCTYSTYSTPLSIACDKDTGTRLNADGHYQNYFERVLDEILPVPPEANATVVLIGSSSTAAHCLTFEDRRTAPGRNLHRLTIVHVGHSGEDQALAFSCGPRGEAEGKGDYRLQEGFSLEFSRHETLVVKSGPLRLQVAGMHTSYGAQTVAIPITCRGSESFLFVSSFAGTRASAYHLTEEWRMERVSGDWFEAS